ncbi:MULTISPECIES: FG-GAP-like repeat-containing protein [unclassified Lentimonas]|uniref:FG-GAP-like repeat-containing protein n=1 Tax=unclassified Lentimonas TaxID=2630993 RepID=UPI001322EDB9|nr:MULTISPECIES: FG-GAP-like repeat-containing protein [unclassified Lentimonas]CAA6690745.1 Unannotated [Lentimonas sp. CC19]CAA6693323.1 Unannotated [Lentimonas sp. CC10]CAA7071803.1 Unannotated [Lentimonas sp. CC11]
MLPHRSILLATAYLLWHGLLGVASAVTPDANWSRNLGTPIASSPIIRDLDDDGDLEILVSSLIGQVFLLDHQGNTLSGWPQSTALFQRTSPNLGDIDGDGKLDVVVGDNDGKLHAWDLNGVSKDGFPIQLVGSIKSVVRLIDLTGDGAAELLVHTGASRLYLLDGAGNDLDGWPIDLGGDPDLFGSWIIASTPTIVDFDYDGTFEIAVGSTNDQVHVFNLDGTAVTGWPQQTGDWVYPSITAIDLDGDYELELVAGSGDGKLYAWRADGSNMPGFPIDIEQPIVASIASANLLGDALPELVVADLSGNVYCYSSTGTLLDGWPQAADSGIVGSPILIDANADGAIDVLVPSRDNTVHIWQADGSSINSPTLTSTDWIEATPSTGDLDNDGLLEIIYASYDGRLYRTELSTLAVNPQTTWPSFHGDQSLNIDLPVGDSDRDALPDQLEYEAFGTLAYNGEDDTDHDGSNNFSEWIAGTNPIAANERFTTEMILDQNEYGTTPGLRWEAQAGRSYQIVYTESLAAAEVNWQPIGQAIHSSQHEIIEWYSNADDLPDQCFYSIQVQRN